MSVKVISSRTFSIADLLVSAEGGLMSVGPAMAGNYGSDEQDIKLSTKPNNRASVRAVLASLAVEGPDIDSRG